MPDTQTARQVARRFAVVLAVAALAVFCLAPRSVFAVTGARSPPGAAGAADILCFVAWFAGSARASGAARCRPFGRNHCQ